MKSNDITIMQLRERLQQAAAAQDGEAFAEAMQAMMEYIADEVREDYKAALQAAADAHDTQVLAARGVRQLTAEEKTYYQKLIEAMKSPDVKQALANLDVIMPETVIDAVLDDITTDHELLDAINFVPTSAAIKLLVNTNGLELAVWGSLTAEIVKELTSGFKAIDTGLDKLSAFLPVSKSMLDLGPAYLDSYVRRVLTEALANGLEAGVVSGTGKDQPIGMIRQVGDGVTVTDGVYPEKTAVAVRDFAPSTMGNLVSLLAVDANGNPRVVRDLILVVNPQDYYQKVMPATTIQLPDGTYRNDVFPVPLRVIQSAALTRGKAVLGMAGRYFACAGTDREGRIDYSDHYQFLEDNRVYLIKLYANGMPLDNNAFIELDITDLQPLFYTVVEKSPVTPSSDATLSALSLGSATLSPAFASATTEYTATTTNASNTITATPSDAGATIVIDVNGTEIDNGAAATWTAGSNTVTITVTAADGTTTEEYTVTVTAE